MQDLKTGDKKVYCRCWLSGTFPLCEPWRNMCLAATPRNPTGSQFIRKSTSISILPIICLVNPCDVYGRFLPSGPQIWLIWYLHFLFNTHTCLWVYWNNICAYINYIYIHKIYTFCWLFDALPIVYMIYILEVCISLFSKDISASASWFC